MIFPTDIPRKRYLVTAGAFASITIVGVFHTIMGTALAEMRTYFGIGIGQAGVFGTAYWLGFSTAVFFSGVLSDRYPRVLVLTGACIITAFSGLTIGVSYLFWLNLAVAFCLGAGNGAVVSSSSALLIEMHTQSAGTMMNLHHFFYALGAIGGPVVMGYLLSIAWRWQLIYRVAGLVSFSVALLLFIIHIGGYRPKADGAYVKRGLIIGETKMFFLVGLTLLGIGTQNGVIFWIVPFFLDVRSVTIVQASLCLALISIGMGVGRLVLVWLSARVSSIRILSGLFICTNISLLAIYLSSSLLLNLVFCFLVGCGFSGLFPILLALGGRMYPTQSGTAVGMISFAAGIGSAMMPWIISSIAEKSSMGLSMGVTSLTALSGLCLVYVAGRTGKFSNF